jgi:hypothetical protein
MANDLVPPVVVFDSDSYPYVFHEISTLISWIEPLTVEEFAHGFDGRGRPMSLSHGPGGGAVRLEHDEPCEEEMRRLARVAIARHWHRRNRIGGRRRSPEISSDMSIGQVAAFLSEI